MIDTALSSVMKGNHRGRPAHPGDSWVPYFVLAIALAITAAGIHYVDVARRRETRQRFERSVLKISHWIDERLSIYVALLHGARGIFSVDPGVKPEEFRAYVDALRLSRNYPGIQGIGFARKVPPEEKAAFVRRMQAQASPSFRLWPEQAGVAFPVTYLDPVDRRNQQSLGYDMFTEAGRRAAMTQAEETGRATASGRVTLAQVPGDEDQPGFLIYLPLYRGGVVPPTVEERRAALVGFVYSPFRTGDLFRGILGTEVDRDIALRIFDGPAPSEETLLYESTGDPLVDTRAELTTERTLDVADRTWTIAFSARPGFASTSTLRPAWLTGVVGLAISMLLFAITRAQAQARLAAERSAADLDRSQRAIRDSEARKRAVLESALDCVITMDHRGRVVEFNPAAERTFGYRNDQVVGRPLADLIIPPALRERHRRGLQRYLTTGESVILGTRIELTGVRADGVEIPVELAITRIDVDEHPMFTAYVRAIGERLAAERELARAKQFRDKVMESAVFGLGALDLAGRFTLVNEEFARMMGYAVEELIGQSYELLLSPANAAELAPLFQRVVGGGERLTHHEIDVLRKDGSTASVIFSWSALHIDGEFTGVVGTVLDISARKRAEAEVRRLNEELEGRVTERTAQLEAANRELEAFSYSVSHDLRAPLRHIDGFLGLLGGQIEPVLTDQSRRYLEVISEATKRMESLIESLLEFSRAGRAEMRQSQVSMAELVAEALLELAPETTGRVIAWETAPLPIVVGDRAMLRQVWVNLLSNAIKYTRDRPRAEVKVGCISREEEVEFFVRDNGRGFDMEYAPKLFGVFQRLHRAEDFEGVGIGLANVQRIVHRHGGRAWAEGRVDVGATFYFTVPTARKE